MIQNDTISNSKFSVSRRDTYYHSYKNLPPVWGSIPGPGKCKVDIICIEPPRGVTLPCREHWQVLVTQLLGGALIEFQIIKKSA